MPTWKVNEKLVINLITPEELNKLPNGTILYCITGERVVKGKNKIDLDTRSGYIAYGRKIK